VLAPALGEEYYAWRFLNPLASYVFAYLFDGPDLCAFLAMRFWESDRRADIIDYGQITGGLVEILFRETAKMFAYDTLSIWDMYLPGELCRALAVLGFKRFNGPGQNRVESLPLLVRPSSRVLGEGDWCIDETGGIDLREPRNWSIRAISSDYY
jgi:hypothetical protein